MMRRITITFDTGRGFTVSENDTHSNELTWEEMLGQIACMTHLEISQPRFRMLTPEEIQAWETEMGYSVRTRFDGQGLPVYD